MAPASASQDRTARIWDVDRDARTPLAAQLLDHLAEAVAEKDRAPTRGQRPIDPPERLLGIYKDAPWARPQSPMGVSSLFTRAPRSPALSGELQAELASADRLDVIMAFVTVEGLRSLRDGLDHKLGHMILMFSIGSAVGPTRCATVRPGKAGPRGKEMR